MSAIAIATHHPLQSLKARTDSVLERGIRISARSRKLQSVLVWVAHLHAIPGLLALSSLLRNGIAIFNSPEADSLSHEELKRVSHDLTQLVGRLRRAVRIYSDSGARRLSPYRWIFDRIEDRAEHLASIAEGMHLSLNEGVGDALVDASEELRSASGDPPERRVLVGQV